MKIQLWKKHLGAHEPHTPANRVKYALVLWRSLRG